MTAPLALCLAGPTACGKSATALALARRLPLEIISVDSAQVYRGMDIGTAKPSAAERAEVPHHLIDILDPTEAYSAARFVADAQRLIAEIRGRGRVPLLVGGTMLYFKALRAGLDILPAADAQVRSAIDAEAAAKGWPSLHAELARVDAPTAARIAPADAQRIQRALEVFRLSGRPLSAWHGATGAAAATFAAERADTLPLLALEPDSRAWLHQRIALRFDDMLAQGLVEEVQRLRKTPGVHADLPSMRCVGYRQTWAALEEGTLRTLKDSGIAATRQLAKRQLTWLRSLTATARLACDHPQVLEQVCQTLQRWALEGGG